MSVRELLIQEIQQAPDSLVEEVFNFLLTTKAHHSQEDQPRQLRPYGLAAGEFTVPDDFDEPLPDDILADFYGE
jgi:hypothetical protein